MCGGKGRKKNEKWEGKVVRKIRGKKVEVTWKPRREFLLVMEPYIGRR